MAIPKFDELLFSILEILSDEREHSTAEIVNILGKKWHLTSKELAAELPSGDKIFYNRASWAKTYLKAAKLIDSPQRAFFVINERGKQALKDKPKNMLEYLKQFDEFLNFGGKKKKDEAIRKLYEDGKNKTPDEMLAHAQESYNDNLQMELLEKLKSVDPIQFERIVLALMEKMNYGVGSVTPISHDGGIDGIINEDELGLERIYLQAKRYSDNKVNEKEMQNFAGALGCSPVRKGVFITTSYFDEKAKRKAESLQGKIIRLIDGEELTRLMIKHNVGLQIKMKVEIKKIDEDFFNFDE